MNDPNLPVASEFPEQKAKKQDQAAGGRDLEREFDDSEEGGASLISELDR